MRKFLSILALALAAHSMCAASLFGDRVVAKGKGFEIKSSEIEETFIAYKANRVASGQQVPGTQSEVQKIEAEILDSLIASRLLLARATEADRTNGVAIARKFIEEKKAASPSEAAFNRQLIVSGLTPVKFEKEVTDQAIVKAVVDRELRSKQTVTDEQVTKFFNENKERLQEPEKWKVAHIYMANRDKLTRAQLSEEASNAKKKRMAEVHVRAKAGVDFAKLVKDYSEHTLTKDLGGETVFMRGQMPPEFEAAAASMKPGQVSDVLASGIGWHIIKLIERIPPQIPEISAAKEKIKDVLLQSATQKAMPDFVAQLRKEAGVEILAEK